MTEQEYHSGFVAVAGRPNVGKSTLLNRIVGTKVAIVSNKPQTTRNRIHCVLTRPNSQVVFLDTPGIHKPHHKLGEYMVSVALDAWNEVEGILFMVDGAAGVGGGDYYIAERLAEVKTPVVLAVNKVDELDKDAELEVLEKASELGAFHSVFPISARTGYNVPELVQTMQGLMPLGPQYYPEDMVTDHPERFIVAELVREQILQHTSQEIPHSVAVQVEEMKPREEKDLIDTRVIIYVERDSQKGIIIGKRGSMLKKVGTAARQEIEKLLGSPIFLELHVKVREDWRARSRALRQFGYTE